MKLSDLRFSASGSTPMSSQGSSQARSIFRGVEIAHPQYYLTRPDSSYLVPMIPLDELPGYIKLTGVQVQMTPEEASGMIHIGQQPKAPAAYNVECSRCLGRGQQGANASGGAWN